MSYDSATQFRVSRITFYAVCDLLRRSYNRREIKMMSLLEFGGDECDNLHFINFKNDVFKIRNNSHI